MSMFDTPSQPDFGSSFTGSSFDSPSEFDVSAATRNVRTISTIESRWRLPQLPEEVKLDLAFMPGVDDNALTQLLLGLDQDLNEEDPVPVPAAERFQRDRTGMEQFQVIASGAMGQGLPKRIDEESIQRFKIDAMRRGLLSPDTPIDSQWSPELNRIRTDMFYDDLDRQFAGDRPGAMSTGSALELLGKWTQPGALLAAATELDLFWDFDAIGKEWSTWGDKFDKLGESKNPWDFAKNLVDAVTGPLDDMVMPVLNWALIGSGVGAMAMPARMAITGGRGAGLARTAFRNLYLPARMSNLTEKGLLASKFLKSESAALNAAGSAMAAWRSLPTVARTKQVVGMGMRLGIASQLQDALPGYQGGQSLASMVPGVDAGAEALTQFSLNSPLSILPELMFAPTTIMNPGAYAGESGLFRAGLRAGQRTIGSTLGRATVGGAAGAGASLIGPDDDPMFNMWQGAAAGAVAMGLIPTGASLLRAAPSAVRGGVLGAGVGGVVALVDDDIDLQWGVLGGAAGGAALLPAGSALSFVPNVDKWVGHPLDVAAKFNFRPLTQDQQVSMAFNNGFEAYLRTLGDQEFGAYAVADWQALVREKGSFHQAFAHYHNITEEEAIEAMAYISVAAFIDHSATVAASGKKGLNQHVYHRVRNKLTNQLQTFDLNGLTIREQVARAMSIDKSNGEQRMKRFKQILDALDDDTAMQWAEAHNRQAAQTLKQLFEDASFEGVGEVGRMGLEGRRAVIEAYLPQVMDRFGNWPQFNSQVRTIDGFLDAGWLDSAEFRKVKTPWGTKRNPKKGAVLKVDRNGEAIDDAVMDRLLGIDPADPLPPTSTVDPLDPFDKVIPPQGQIDLGDGSLPVVPPLGQASRPQLNPSNTVGRFAPLARMQPWGTTTLARVDSVTAQEMEEVILHLDEAIDQLGKIDFLRKNGVLKRLAEAIEQRGGLEFHKLSKKEVDAFLNHYKIPLGGPLREVLEVMRRHKVEVDGLEAFMNQRVEAFLSNTNASLLDGRGGLTVIEQPLSRFGLAANVTDADGKVLTGVDALRKHVKQLKKQRQYTAAAIDTDALVASVRSRFGDDAATELATQLRNMERDGYQLVHGVEFMMPQKLASMDGLPFADFGAKQMNARTFGNFFGRKQPVQARLNAERRARSAIVKALAGDYAPDSAEVNTVMDDLYGILLEVQDPVAQMTRDRHMMSMMDKATTAAKSAFTPQRVEDLTSRREFVIKRLQQRGWDLDEAQRIFSAIRNFRADEFDNLGLYALEARLRKQNLAVTGMKWLTNSSLTEGFTSPARIGMAAGGFTGLQLGANATSENDSEDVQFGYKIGAALLGAVGGAALGKVAAKGAKVGFKAAAESAGYADPRIWAENKPSWMLFDHLARFRDAMRFSLNPMFDLSRYTEGLVLGVTGTPQRLADGSRVVLPTNLSPKATIGRHGRAVFDEHRAEFAMKLRGAGHGDLDVLDEAAHHFEQIGIMGFSPMDWQNSIFLELRQAGMDIDEAYEAARRTHTYGLHGRSAAEMSTNFIFFPFSFQKKMMTHVADFVSQDLGRSIMLHDAYRTYQELDEKFDLDTFWEEHIPAMRQLQRLNSFAYGISPGRFGGMNAQLLETTGRALAQSVTMFQPVGVNIRGEEDWLELKKLTNSLLPVWNDINWLTHDVKNAKGLIDAGMLDRGQVRRGYEEWNVIRSDFGARLDKLGMSWSDLYTKDWAQDLRWDYERQKIALERKYPAWKESRTESIFNVQALEMERNDRIMRATVTPESASQQDVLLMTFERYVEEAKQELRWMGVSIDDADGWYDAPLDVHQRLLGAAVMLADQNPAFLTVYRKFYEKELGPIEVAM
jgi:hypothetical protein